MFVFGFGFGYGFEAASWSFLRRISSRALSHDDWFGVLEEAVEKEGLGGGGAAADGFCHAPALGVHHAPSLSPVDPPV